MAQTTLSAAEGLRDTSNVLHNRDSLVRRSTLIVPAHVDRFVRGAVRSGADAVMLDLEDGVGPAFKDRAREALKPSVEIVRAAGPTILIRVNNDSFAGLVADLVVATAARPDGLFVPKIESAEELLRCDAVIATREVELGLPFGSLELAVSLETPRGILALNEICAAMPARVATLAFGSEDIAMELGINATDAGLERLVGNSLVVLAAAAHRLQPLGLLGDLTNYKDLAALETAARRSFQFGFMGSYCIHPSQVPVFNRAFSPAPDEVAFARSVEAARSRGQGQAGHIDGTMVAASAFRQSERLLRRLAHIEKSEGQRGP